MRNAIFDEELAVSSCACCSLYAHTLLTTALFSKRDLTQWPSLLFVSALRCAEVHGGRFGRGTEGAVPGTMCFVPFRGRWKKARPVSFRRTLSSRYACARPQRSRDCGKISALASSPTALGWWGASARQTRPGTTLCRPPFWQLLGGGCEAGVSWARRSFICVSFSLHTIFLPRIKQRRTSVTFIFLASWKKNKTRPAPFPADREKALPPRRAPELPPRRRRWMTARIWSTKPSWPSRLSAMTVSG